MKHSGKKSEADKLQQKADHAIERYRELYDFAPSGYFTLSRGSEITEHNHTGAQMLGREHANLINNRFDIFVSEILVRFFIISLNWHLKPKPGNPAK